MTLAKGNATVMGRDVQVGDGIPFLSVTHVVRGFEPFAPATVRLFAQAMEPLRKSGQGRVALSDDGWRISVPDDWPIEIVR